MSPTSRFSLLLRTKGGPWRLGGRPPGLASRRGQGGRGRLGEGLLLVCLFGIRRWRLVVWTTQQQCSVAQRLPLVLWFSFLPGDFFFQQLGNGLPFRCILGFAEDLAISGNIPALAENHPVPFAACIQHANAPTRLQRTIHAQFDRSGSTSGQGTLAWSETAPDPLRTRSGHYILFPGTGSSLLPS